MPVIACPHTAGSNAAVLDSALHALCVGADAALARAAVPDGGRVVVLRAVTTTLEPTRRLFLTAAAATGAVVEMRLVPGAWTAFKPRDHGRYLAMIADAAGACCYLIGERLGFRC